ncbi:hypothetical protein CLERM_116 [Coxiella-like endosymbiont]|nr:hypothetical protein CLERM_116 [Coxiella-like endosymbiont]
MIFSCFIMENPEINFSNLLSISATYKLRYPLVFEFILRCPLLFKFVYD